MLSSQNALNTIKTIVNTTLSEIPTNTDNSCKVVLTQLDATIEALINQTEDADINVENISLKSQLARTTELKETYAKDIEELQAENNALTCRVSQLEKGLAVTQENESYQVKIREEFANKLERVEKRYENLRKRYYALNQECDKAKSIYKDLEEAYQVKTEEYIAITKDRDEFFHKYCELQKQLETKLKPFNIDTTHD